MPAPNQLLINDEVALCRPCNRYFKSDNAALQHCRDARAHQGAWCDRCERLFTSPQARSSHDANSTNHNICYRCKLDFSTDEGLEQHNGDIHHKCLECNREFSNNNQLEMHLQVYQPEDTECFGCDREFSSLSGMMIHLESGNCESRVNNEKIEEWAFEEDWHDYLNHWYDNYKFTCPTCGTNFRFLSALLQHVESPACDQEVEGSVQDLMAELAGKVYNHRR